MHRVRQSLPYFCEFGWQPITVAVDPVYMEEERDEALLKTIPADLELHLIPALDYRNTRKLGLGNLGLRSLISYAKAGNQLIRRNKIDLIYFSTTAFPLPILGAYWKRKFNIPYVIDIQDPWHSDFYLSRPKSERPPKFWFSYRLDKYTEPLALRSADGIIAVSRRYCETFSRRYANITSQNCTVIPFGGAEIDFEVLPQLNLEQSFFDPADGHTHVVYVGRGGHDMSRAAEGIFQAFARGLQVRPDLFRKVKMHFIGTSYATAGQGVKTLQPIAESYGLLPFVCEHTDRVPYFTAMKLLRDGCMLVLLGSTDPGYTASKLYPYILARRPMLAVFNENSSVVEIMNATGTGEVVTFKAKEEENDSDSILSQRILETWIQILERLPFTPETDWEAFAPYTAREMTRRQTAFFDRILARPSQGR